MPALLLFLFVLVPALALPTLAGYGLLRWWRIRTELLTDLARSYALGALLTALLSLGYWWLFPGSYPFALVAGTLLALGLLGLAAPRDPDLARARPRRDATWARWVFRAALFVAIALVLRRVLADLEVPIVLGDEATFWAHKAKLLWLHGGPSEDFARAMRAPGPELHPSYPNLSPLLLCWIYGVHDEVVHMAARLPAQGAALAQILLLASALRRHAGPAIAALLVLVYVCCPFTAALTSDVGGETFVSFGLLLALDAWLRRVRGPEASSRRTRLGLFVSFGLGFALYAKNEGLLYLGAACVAAALTWACLGPRRLSRLLVPTRAWLLALPALAVLTVHLGTNATLDFGSTFSNVEGGNLLGLFFARLPTQVGPVLSYYFEHVLFSWSHSALLLVFALLLLALRPRAHLRRREILVPCLALTLAHAGLLATVIAAAHPTQLSWLLDTALPRICFQPLAATTLWLGVLLRRTLGPAAR